jgi:hypothetical protein
VSSGYSYEAEAEQTDPCSYSGGEQVWVNSVVFVGTGAKVNAQVTQNSVTYCGTVADQPDLR